MRVRSLRMLAALALAGLGTSALHGQPQAPQPSSREVVERARRYVASYRPRLAELVAEEQYTQTAVGEASRRLVADFAVVRADDGMWVGFRDVWQVDGKELSAHERRAEQLLGGDRLDWASARRIIEESARHNVPVRSRDFNTPVAALELLDEGRKTCCRVKASPVSGRRTWRLRVEERQRPTLVRRPDGKPVFSSAEFVVEPDTGAIVASTLRVGNEHPVTLSVTFRFDETLTTWVPAELHERFEIEDTGHMAEGHAGYTRWRRFQTSSRILPVP